MSVVAALALTPLLAALLATLLPSAAPSAPVTANRRAPTVRVEVVQTLVDPAQRLLSDDELLALLDAIGRPTGLVRVGDTVTLTAAVTDEALARKREPLPPGESLR